MDSNDRNVRPDELEFKYYHGEEEFPKNHPDPRCCMGIWEVERMLSGGGPGLQRLLDEYAKGVLFDELDFNSEKVQSLSRENKALLYCVMRVSDTNHPEEMVEYYADRPSVDDNEPDDDDDEDDDD